MSLAFSDRSNPPQPRCPGAPLRRAQDRSLPCQLRHGVLTLTEVVVADLSLLICDVQCRPVVVGKGAPDSVVAIERNRVFHPHVIGCLDHVIDVALEAELWSMNPYHSQAVIVVFGGPLTHIRQRSKPVDAGVGPELHSDDASLEPLWGKRLRVEPSGCALERWQTALARQDLRSGLPMRGEEVPIEAHRKPPPSSR